MPTATELIVLGSEIALALHPILLKTIDVPLITQILFRMGTYSALAGISAEGADWTQTWGSFDAIKNTVASGLMNLVHIGSSYASYKHLSAGSALALFYTYPFMNILAGILFLGDPIPWRILPWLLLAFAGVILVSHAETEREKNGDAKLEEGLEADRTPKNTIFGIAMALISAATETLIFLIVKTSERKNPFVNILQLYPAGFLALGGYAWFKGFKDVKGSPKQIAQIIAFNIFIGFLGYSLRFFSIPRLSTVVFSLLTFVGVAAGYLWGSVFAGEKPSWMALLGSGCITGSVAALELLK